MLSVFQLRANNHCGRVSFEHASGCKAVNAPKSLLHSGYLLLIGTLVIIYTIIFSIYMRFPLNVVSIQKQRVYTCLAVPSCLDDCLDRTFTRH